MSKFLAICFRELRSLVLSPVAAVCAAMFLLVSGYLYYSIAIVASLQAQQLLRLQQMPLQLNANDVVLVPSLRNLSVILLLVVPILTMRLFAEEKKQRTQELLFTSPVTIPQIVLGKYCAVLVLYGGLLVLTLYMPLLLHQFSVLAWGPVVSGYLGLFLVGAVFLSIGLFASSLTENQVVAAMVSFALLLLLWLIGWTGAAATDPGMKSILSYLSLLDHLNNFLNGLVDTKDVVYCLGLIAVGLFLTHRVVESHRWR